MLEKSEIFRIFSRIFPKWKILEKWPFSEKNGPTARGSIPKNGHFWHSWVPTQEKRRFSTKNRKIEIFKVFRGQSWFSKIAKNVSFLAHFSRFLKKLWGVIGVFANLHLTRPFLAIFRRKMAKYWPFLKLVKFQRSFLTKQRNCVAKMTKQDLSPIFGVFWSQKSDRGSGVFGDRPCLVTFCRQNPKNDQKPKKWPKTPETPVFLGDPRPSSRFWGFWHFWGFWSYRS